jgi:hypothetical protein
MMFVRVKKIGAYGYLYLVENAREADDVFSAWSKRCSVGTRSRRPRCWMRGSARRRATSALESGLRF